MEAPGLAVALSWTPTPSLLSGDHSPGRVRTIPQAIYACAGKKGLLGFPSVSLSPLPCSPDHPRVQHLLNIDIFILAYLIWLDFIVPVELLVLGNILNTNRVARTPEMYFLLVLEAEGWGQVGQGWVLLRLGGKEALSLQWICHVFTSFFSSLFSMPFFTKNSPYQAYTTAEG